MEIRNLQFFFLNCVVLLNSLCNLSFISKIIYIIHDENSKEIVYKFCITFTDTIALYLKSVVFFINQSDPILKLIFSTVKIACF